MIRMEIQTSIKVENLFKRFGRTTAIDGISFSLDGVGPFGIVGPDGSGKTTLIRILAGVMLFQGGLSVMDWKYPRESNKAKKYIGYMPQSFGLYRDLSVKENLLFYGRIFGMTSAEITERLPRLLEFSRLTPFADRIARKLSGGMKQKLALSTCLMHDPKLLILDEPGAGVDPVSRREFWSIIEELVSQGIIVVIATTYMDEAERCSRIIYLKDGKIIADGSPSEIRENYPLKVYSFRCEKLREFREMLEESGEFANVNFFGDQIHAAGQVGSSEVVKFVESQKAGMFNDLSWEQVQPELEDVFVHLGGEKQNGWE